MTEAGCATGPVAGPEVSVVIIFCNEEEHLGEAVASVFTQTFGQWELLLVDDGSTDASSEIARRLATQHPGRVRYLNHRQHQRRGMSASRNLGVRSARGRWVAHLDGDDRWQPDKLANQVRLMAAHPDAAVVYGPLIRWRTWTGREGEIDDRYGIHGDGFTLPTNTLFQPPELVAHFIRHKDLVPSGALFRRQAFLAVGGAEESFTDNYEDAVVFTKIGLRHAIFCADESWYLYRQYPYPEDKAHRRRSRPDADRPRGDAARSTFLDWVDSYLRANDISDPTLESALRSARRQIDQPNRHRVHRLVERGRRAPRRVLDRLGTEGR